MDSKLTLKLDKTVIEQAKEYAKEHQTSLSRLIESYLALLTSKEKKEDEFEISPFVKSISTGVSISNDIDIKKEYGDYLIKKYK
ncbi:DUF6364 family protein [uncultured Polaribacter sp.]|uniref:DUF6364 family protein n=1 Tax=uncultured Polaribacter sp. TaxID=174711 RepID=UPI002614432B|nr:DUF6364 family protein [uncultured Polaribacter sp.]